MKITSIKMLKVVSLMSLALFWASCGETTKVDSNPEDDTIGSSEVVQEETHDHSDHNNAEVKHDGGEYMSSMDSKGADLGYAEGSWAWNLQDFMNNGTGSQTFILDKIPFEGDEISVEGNQQLDDLAELLRAHPDLTAEVQAHTPAADNAIGRTAKKTASTARAAWVQLKLKTRGVDGKQLSSKGYADEMLLENLDPKDDGQKRLAIVITK